MTFNNVRVIVATHSSEFFDVIKSGLLSDSRIEMTICVSTPDEAENKLTRTKPNALIIDLDKNAPRYTQLKEMCDRFQLLVLLTGVSNMYAVPLIKGPIRDFILKPPVFTTFTKTNYIQFMLSKITKMSSVTPAFDMREIKLLTDINSKVIAIASSTGGTDALEKIFRALPGDLPPILVVQHMPSGFTKLFADRLNNFCEPEVREPQSGEYIKKGVVYIARAGFHMRLVKQGARLTVEYFQGAKVHGVIPSADVLFESVAENIKKNAIGVILTGMGSDGAKGLMLMHMSGAKTIGQNEQTCVVYGMPRAAKELGVIDKELPLDRISDEIIRWARE